MGDTGRHAESWKLDHGIQIGQQYETEDGSVEEVTDIMVNSCGGVEIQLTPLGSDGELIENQSDYYPLGSCYDSMIEGISQLKNTDKED